MREYIASRLDEEDDDGTKYETDQARIKNCVDRFRAEFDSPGDRRARPNRTGRLAAWLQGLGGPIALDYVYCDIVKQGKAMGYKCDTPRTEQAFCDKWWTLCAVTLVVMAHDHGLEF